MSLADELMADLEGSDEEEELEVKKEEEEMESEDIKPSKLELEQVSPLFFQLTVLQIAHVHDYPKVPKKQTLSDIAVLHNSDRLFKIMKRIDKWQVGWSQPADIN